MADEQHGFVLEPAPILPPASPEQRRRRRVALAGLLALALLATIALLVAGGRIRLPALPPPPRVVIVAPDGGLVVVDPRTGAREDLAAPGPASGFPAWSPDGTRVAAITQGTGGATLSVLAPSVPGVALYDGATSEPFYLYWTPDGTGVGFLTSEGPSIALRLAPLDRSVRQTVLREGAPLYWAWDAAGRALVHAGGTEGDPFIGEVTSDGAIVGSVDGMPGDFRAPAVSSDGRYRAYEITRADGISALVTAAGDGSMRHDVDVAGPAAFEFAPSGTALAFVAPTSGDQSAGVPIGPLRVVDAATGTVRDLLDRQVLGFFWSPDARTIAVLATPDPETPGAVGDRAGARLVSGIVDRGTDAVEADDAGPGIGATLAFVDAASGAVRSERALALSESFVGELLPYFDQYARSHRLWAPDGSSLVLPVVTDGEDVVELIPPDGSGARPVAPGTAGFWSP